MRAGGGLLASGRMVTGRIGQHLLAKQHGDKQQHEVSAQVRAGQLLGVVDQVARLLVVILDARQPIGQLRTVEPLESPFADRR